MRKCAVAFLLLWVLWLLSGRRKTLAERTACMNWCRCPFREWWKRDKKNIAWIARGIYYVVRPVYFCSYVTTTTAFSQLFGFFVCCPTTLLSTSKMYPNTFACIIKNVLKRIFTTVLGRYDCCRCSIRLPSNRLSLFRHHLAAQPLFLSTRTHHRMSVAPNSLFALHYFFFFSPVVCASYSKHIIHLKLPNDFLLNASERQEKKPNSGKKKECDFSYVIRDDFWLRWHMRKMNGIVEFTSHTCVGTQKRPGKKEKSKPITLQRRNRQRETKETSTSARMKKKYYSNDRITSLKTKFNVFLFFCLVSKFQATMRNARKNETSAH